MDFTQARQNMIDGQLTPNKVTSRELLKHMSELPRESFVDASSKETAYVDSPSSVGYERQIFTPLVCARLLQALQVQSDEKILVLASNTGYTSALASRLGAEVYMVEEDRNLCDRSRRVLADCKCDVEIANTDPALGWGEDMTFDKMIIDAPVDEIPQAVLSQLADGGLVGAVVRKNDVMVVSIIRKVKKTLFEEHLFETTGSVLSNFEKEEKFVF